MENQPLAEIAPVEEPTTPVAEPESPQVIRTSPSAAVAPPTPEASAPTEPEATPTDTDDGFGDFLKEVGIESVPGTTTSVPSDEAPPDPKVMEAAERLYQQRVTEANERIQSQQLAQTYDQTPNRIYHSLVADGMAPSRALEYYNEVRSIGQAAESVLGPRTNVQTVQSFYDEMAKLLPKGEAEKFVSARGVDHKSPADTARAFAELSRKGYVSERDAKDRETKAVVDKLKELDSQNLLVRNRKPSDASGNTIATIGRMNFKTLGEAEAAHVAGQISNAQMRELIAKGLPR